MGLFDRVERRLDRVINGAFARAFKAEVQPVEIASAIRRAMDERAAIVDRGRTIVPNVFTIELDATDYERLTEYDDVLVSELLASMQEHAESQRYQPGGPLHVKFRQMEDLDTGVFRVRPSTDPNASPQRPQAHSSPAQRRYETARPHRPRNLPYPPEATSPAEGAIGMAGHAASAAAGAVAGTAAAGRAGDYLAHHEPLAEKQARQAQLTRDAERARAAREVQRRRDRAAWGDDEDEAAPAASGASAPAAQPAPAAPAAPGAPGTPADQSDQARSSDEPRRSGYPDYPGPHQYDEEDALAGRSPGFDYPQAREASDPDQGDYPDHRRAYDYPEHPDHSGYRQYDEPGHQHRDALAEYDDPPYSEVDDPHDMTVRRGDEATRVHTVAPPMIADPAHRPWIELDGDTYPLLVAISVIGRDTTSDITLDDPGVSRRHAEIRVTHDGPHLVVGLRDLGSTNGTYVNGERITSARLEDGDRVTVGRISFTLRTRRR